MPCRPLSTTRFQLLADEALEQLLAQWPDAQSTFRKNHFERWIFSQPELIARVEEGFAKVGLKFD